ncbi:MAG: AAA family ATPase [Anaerolineae bacterium]|nr:AAA family ATPase [Anaerolineae bacterium]
MRFSHIVLENWRNFGHVEVPLQNRAFLIGPNASGKSNFLDAFRFLRDIAPPGGSFRNAVESRGGVSRIRNFSARRYPDIAVEVTLSEGLDETWRYRLVFNQDNVSRPFVKEERVWRGSNLLLNRPNEEDRQDEVRRYQTHLEQTSANRDFRDIASAFADVRYFHIVPQLVRDPERSIGRENDPYGGDFLQQIAQANKRTQDARLSRIQEALKVAVPQLSELRFEVGERGELHLKGKYSHWRPRGAWQDETDFSDGTLRLIGLLWALFEGDGPLLLEEPELSLHPGIVRYLPQMMLRVQRSQKRAPRQILLSTHSSDLLRDKGITADETLLFIPSTEGSEVRRGTSYHDARMLLETTDLTVADVLLPRTEPENAQQLPLLGE